MSRECRGNDGSGYHERQLESLPKGICPYRDGWPSGHPADLLWPPIEVRIFVRGANHHNRCKCWWCKPEAQRRLERRQFHRETTFAEYGIHSFEESEAEAVPSPISLAS